MTDRQLLYTADMARLLHKSPEAVRAQVRRDPESLPPAFLIGRRICWIESDVDEWFEERKAEQRARIRAERAFQQAAKGTPA